MIQISLATVRPFVGQLTAVALTSAALATAAALVGAPLWLIGALALVPWLPLFAGLTVATRRSLGGWMAFYLVLVVTQAGHVFEHVVQVVQLRVLHEPQQHAHGIFGAFDVEWVHFLWNAWILLAVVALIIGRPNNRWLWLAVALAAWHLGEHVVLITTYLLTGIEGSPGLLAMGGLIGDGLPIARPDLHLIYNILETAPLFVGLAVEARRGSVAGRA